MSNYENTEDLESDFEKGRFSNPATVGDLPYAELERRVFAAIDERFCTYTRIRAHAGLERGFDLTPVIQGMELEKKIHRFENGTITAFFRYDDRPIKVSLTGDGTVKAEYGEANDQPAHPLIGTEAVKGSSGFDARPKVEISTDRLEELAESMPNRKAIAGELGIGLSTLELKIRESVDLREAYNRGRDKRTEAANVKIERTLGTPAVREKRPYRTDIDWARLEEVTGTVFRRKNICQELGTSLQTLNRKMDASAELKAAFERGRKTFKANNPEGPLRKSHPTSSTRSRARKDVSEQALEAAASKLYSQRQIALELNVSYATLVRRMADDPKLAAAFKRGRDAFVAANPQVTTKPGPKPAKDNPDLVRDADEVLTESSNPVGDRLEPVRTFTDSDLEESRASFEQALDEFAPKSEIVMDVGPPYERAMFEMGTIARGQKLLTPHLKSLELEKNSRLMIGFEGNFFNLPGGQRNLLNQIADLVQEYEEENV